MRRVLLNVHLLIGLILGPILVVLGVTGALLVFEPAIDRALNPRLLRVLPEDRHATLDEIARVVRTAYPEDPIARITFATRADESYQVQLLGGRTVFVDPATPRVLGDRGRDHAVEYLLDLHLRLMAGETGNLVVAIAGVLTLVSAVTGLILWWPTKILTLRRRASWRGTNFTLHQVLGFYSSAVLFLISLSGVMMYFNDSTSRIVRAVTGSAAPATVPRSTPHEGAHRVSLEDAVRTARQALPGAKVSFVLVPHGDRALRVQLHFPEDRTGAGRSVVYLDGYSGAFLQVQSRRARDLGTAILNERRSVHTGEILGLPTRIVALVVSLALAGEVVTGWLIWLRRRGRP